MISKDGIAELAKKNNLLLNTEYQRIDRYLTAILYLGERGTLFLSGKNIPGDCECVGPPVRHSTNTAAPPQTIQAR